MSDIMSWQVLPIAEFAQASPTWRRLNIRFGGTPLLDPLFLVPLIEEFSSGGELLCLFNDSSSLGAATILSRAGPFAWQTFQPANAPLGAWLLDPDLKIEPVIDSLIYALPGPTMLLGLSQIDPEFMSPPLPSNRVVTFDYIRTARLDIGGSYEDYWAGRSKNLKHNMNRQRNRLSREGRVMRLETLREPAQMRGAVADYARLESSGWKGVSASAVNEDDAQGRFYNRMLTSFAERDEAIVYRYYYDDNLVASDLCLIRDKVLIILKTTHDETQKGTSPAHLMRHQIIEGAFGSGDISRVEFYGPAQDWHLRWTDDVRTIYHLNYYRSALASHIHRWARLLTRS